MSEPFLGEIEYFAFAFPPKNWSTCAGQLLPIKQNPALFSLLGTAFGGDGINTFGLPDLRGRVAVGQGQARNLSPYVVGQNGGQESITLAVPQIPAHTHAATAVGAPPATPVASPAGNLLSVVGNPTAINIYGTGNPAPMAAATVANAGGGQSHDNRMPYLALNPCIALVGIFPSRS